MHTFNKKEYWKFKNTHTHTQHMQTYKMHIWVLTKKINFFVNRHNFFVEKLKNPDSCAGAFKTFLEQIVSYYQWNPSKYAWYRQSWYQSEPFWLKNYAQAVFRCNKLFCDDFIDKPNIEFFFSKMGVIAEFSRYE